MKNISVELKVGAVVIIAAILLFLGVIWIKEYRFNVKRYEYSALFPNIGSLEIGDPVCVLGVKKGEVKSIDLKGNDVLVGFSLTKDVTLKIDARFTVMNIGLMGERFINIIPGVASEDLNLAIPMHGYYDTGIPEVMGMMGAGIDELRHLIAVLEGTIGTPEMTASIRETLNNLNQISSSLNGLINQNQDKLNQAATDLATSSSKLRGFIDRNEAGLENTVSNLDKASDKFVVLSSRLDTLSTTVLSLLTKLQSGQGTLGRALNEDSLYQNLLFATSNLDSLLTDFKRNPKKYIHFSVF